MMDENERREIPDMREKFKIDRIWILIPKKEGE